MKQVMILTGAGQIGMAIARRMGAGMKIVIGDKSPQHAASVAETMNRAGFDAVPVEMELSSRDSILALIDTARSCGEISMLVNAAGSPRVRLPSKQSFGSTSTAQRCCWRRSDGSSAAAGSA